MQKNEVVIPFNQGLNNRVSEFNPGQMTESTNSCLTVEPSEVVRPMNIVAVDESPYPYAVAVTAKSENVVVYPGVNGSQYLVTPTGTAPLTSKLVNTAAQNLWRPWQVEHADTMPTPGGSFYCSVVQTTTSGNIVRAVIELDAVSNTVRTTLSATDSSHRVILQPTVLGGAAQPKLLDVGGDDVALAYIDTGAILKVRKLTFASGTYSVGSATILGALAASLSATLYSATSTRTEAAIYLLYSLNSAGTVAVVSKYNTNTSTFDWTNTYATARATTAWTCGIDAGSLGGTIYVSAAWSDTSGVESVILNSAGTVQRARSTRSGTLKLRVAPFMAIVGGDVREVIACTTDTVGIASPVAVKVLVSNVPDTVSLNFDVHTHNLIAPEAAPVVQGADRLPCYALAFTTDPANANDLADPNYIVDPSLELFVVGRVDVAGGGGELWAASPAARLGVDRAYLQSRQGLLVNAGLGAGNGSVQVSFQKDELQGVEFNEVAYDLPYPARCALAGNTALVAAAQPVYWDGVETVEVSGPLHRPMMTPVGGTAGSPGVAYRAAVVWRDASGDLHRSPATAATAEYTTPPTGFAVAWPDTFRDGKRQDYSGVEIYSQDPATSQTWYLTRSSVATGNTIGTYTLLVGATGAIDPAFPALYSDGSPLQELVPEAPPAMWDVAFASGRAWYIDATRRNVAGYSKLPQPGLGIEFNAALQITFPIEAGNLVSVQDMGGVPVFFAERGVYVVLGDGPDNIGQGTFAPPRLAASVLVHPGSRNVTVRTPVGIFFRTLRGYAILGPDYQVKYLDAFEELAVASRATALVLEASNEVALVANGSTEPWVVYNYAADAWTHWNYTARVTDLNEGGGSQPACNAIALFDRASSETRLYLFTDTDAYTGLREASGELNSSWAIGTSHSMPSGLAGRCAWHEVQVYVRPVGSNDLDAYIRVEVFQDYSSTATATQDFYTDEVAANTTGNLAVLRVKPGKGDARSLRIRVSSSTEPYFHAHPIQAIVKLTAEGGSNTRSVGTLK